MIPESPATDSDDPGKDPSNPANPANPAICGSTSDAELVRSFLQSRSEDCFLELYRRHTPRLFQLCLRLVAWSEEEAEEIVQQSWLVAAQRLESFAWQSSLATWLTGIMINVFRDHRRATQRRRNETSDNRDRQNGAQNGAPDEPWELPDPALGLDLDLEDVIRQLPDGYREVLVLHDIEGYTHAEIAPMLEVGIGTSKSQLFQARRRMRHLWRRETVEKTS